MQILGTERVPIKGWTEGVFVEEQALQQLRNTASLPFIHKHIAVMPDVHLGIGATVGSVIPTKGAIIPAAVGVDIGCGMMAVRLSLTASQLPDSLAKIRSRIEEQIPVGNADNQRLRSAAEKAYTPMDPLYKDLIARHPEIEPRRHPSMQMGSLGGGNHFIELCIDENQHVWVMLHSGSRGIGNRIGKRFIELAREDMRTHFINLPDKDLAYFAEGTQHFKEYWEAVEWAQNYARANRETMMNVILRTLSASERDFPAFTVTEEAVNCHHNYVSLEHHFGENVYVTRKGAVRARKGDLGVIPGSMGAKSFIVRGLGNEQSFCSCSHGAGRIMSRTKAKELVSLDDHIKATEGVECRKDAGVLDESPAAYKNIDAVMAAQSDLVEIVHTLKQVLCVKG